MRYRRRATRKLDELPSLFGEEEIYGDSTSSAAPRPEVIVAPDAREDAAADDLLLADSFSRPLRQLKFISFGSGSSGNCSYIGTSDCGLLIDAGVNNTFVISELARNGISTDSIKGILLTHDHGDHVKFAYALVRRFSKWRIYATPRTVEGILMRHNLSRRIRDYHTPIYKEHEYIFGDIKVIPFATSHDGSDNLGFMFEMDRTRFVVCTDTGRITDRADYYLRQATSIMIESNYDLEMLMNGPYKEYLKARIRSEIGHLDNTVTSKYIASTYRPGLSHIFLCHLSEENNTPQIAVSTLCNALNDIGISPAASAAAIIPGTVYIAALPRFRSSELFVL